MGIDLQDFTQKQVQSSETNESLIIKKGVRIIDYSTDNKGIQYSDFALPKSSDSQVSSESESDSDTDPIQNKTSADVSFIYNSLKYFFIEQILSHQSKGCSLLSDFNSRGM